MYQLFYDELSNQFFVADDVDVEAGLKKLTNKLKKRNGSFSYTDYLKTLGIKDERPVYKKYKKCRFYKENTDYPDVFDVCLAMRSINNDLDNSAITISINIPCSFLINS